MYPHLKAINILLLRSNSTLRCTDPDLSTEVFRPRRTLSQQARERKGKLS
jgi:hypothetical protein